MKCIYVVAWFVLLVEFLFAAKEKGAIVISNEMTAEFQDFETLIMEILLSTLRPYKCVAMITDSIYYDVLKDKLFRKFGIYLSYFLILVEDSEDLLSPYPDTKETLIMAKRRDCQTYVILISNGIQMSRLLRFGDRYRVLDTRANFILLYDHRLFRTNLHYLWKRIVNVIFIREYGGVKRFGKDRKVMPWFEITTVPFPSPIKGVFVPRRLDIWRKSKFRSGADLFRDKTSDLKNQTLRVVTFKHTPATTKIPFPEEKTVRVVMGSGEKGFAGLEVEILATVSKAMNFRSELYEPPNADLELWGRKQSDGQYSGLYGEMVNSKADIALGDLYYTSYILELMDLTIPYYTQCLTFLTPESLTDNSWKTLILPFKTSMAQERLSDLSILSIEKEELEQLKSSSAMDDIINTFAEKRQEKPVMWALVILCLLLCGVIFYLLARFHCKFSHTKVRKKMSIVCIKKKKVITLPIITINRLDPHMKYTLMKEQHEPRKVEGESEGLYLFAEMFNSMLYTYSMLLMVSLPKLPTGWSLRMITGWYWLYCTLVVVAYRASMTAILANPAPRVTIDTLQEVVDSQLSCGGWGEINREFFKTSLDPASQIIGSKFEIVNNSDEALDRVAAGTFAFYENVYFLKEAAVKRQVRHQILKSGPTSNESHTATVDESWSNERNLHIMRDCIINMPISIGLQKNSPIKPRVDKFIRTVLEAGLIKKWLDDVMQPTLNAEIPTTQETTKALMNMRKFIGALVALFVGYFISIVAFVTEICYFNYVVKKHPQFNKYSKRIHYHKSM